MTSVSPVPAYSYSPKFHINIVMDDDKALRRHRLTLCERCHGAPGKVHIGVGFCEDNLLGFSNLAATEAFSYGDIKPLRKPVYNEVANVVPGEGIFRTFVAKTA
jgi:hypothetical protein